MISDPTSVSTINAAVCMSIVLVIAFYRRGKARHRPVISVMAWLLVVLYSAVPLAYLCGIYSAGSPAAVCANIVFLSVVLCVRGNVARIFDFLRF